LVISKSPLGPETWRLVEPGRPSVLPSLTLPAYGFAQ
jgi:hypothetical protein